MQEEVSIGWARLGQKGQGDEHEVKLHLVIAGRQRDVKLDLELALDRHFFDALERPAGGEDEPEVGELLARVERRDDRLVGLVLVLVGLAVKRDADRDRRRRVVRSLVDRVRDLNRGIGVDKLGDVAPGEEKGRRSAIDSCR